METPKPVLLQILLGLMILVDAIGFILFIISLVPVVGTGFAAVISFPLDIVAGLSFFVFITLQVSNDTNFIFSNIDRLKELSKGSKGFAKLQGLITQKAQDFVFKTVIWRTVLFAVSAIIELIPILGDFSPTWSITTVVIMNARATTLSAIAQVVNDGIAAVKVQTKQMRSTWYGSKGRVKQTLTNRGKYQSSNRDRVSQDQKLKTMVDKQRAQQQSTDDSSAGVPNPT